MAYGDNHPRDAGVGTYSTLNHQSNNAAKMDGEKLPLLYCPPRDSNLCHWCARLHYDSLHLRPLEEGGIGLDGKVRLTVETEIQPCSFSKEEQKKKFYHILEKHVEALGRMKRQTFSIKADTYTKIISALQLPNGQKCENGSHFKFWSKNNFILSTDGATQVLYCKKLLLPVATTEEMFDVIKDCHERIGHGGREKTWEELRANFSRIKHDAVSLFLQTCATCTAARQPARRHNQDIVDMSDTPDGLFRYILHMQDRFSRYIWAYPLKSSVADEVAAKLIETFCLFGFPDILESDQAELVSEVIQKLRQSWPDLIIIHEQPESVDDGSRDLETRLSNWIEDNDNRWSRGLNFVVFETNSSTSSVTLKTPYKMVFGQTARGPQTELDYLPEQRSPQGGDLAAGFGEDNTAGSKSPMLKDSQNAGGEKHAPTGQYLLKIYAGALSQKRDNSFRGHESCDETAMAEAKSHGKITAKPGKSCKPPSFEPPAKYRRIDNFKTEPE